MVNQHLDCDEDEADKTRNYLFFWEKSVRGEEKNVTIL